MVMILIGALVIGLALGMLGSGGSAITVPVLIYLVGHGTKESIAESMAIVGLISLFAAVPYARSKQIDWRSVVYFGTPGMFGTFLGAWAGGYSSDTIQLVVFGAVMLIAAYSMLRKPAPPDQADPSASKRTVSPLWKLAIEGTLVGALTGFVGVGGGFLIVPALVLLGNLPIRLAIGTSLAIITAKSAIGFTKYEQILLSNESSVSIQTILLFTVIGVVGSLIGRSMNARLNQRVLQKLFAGFLVLLGGFVILREASKAFHWTETHAVASAIDSRPARNVIANTPGTVGVRSDTQPIQTHQLASTE